MIKEIGQRKNYLDQEPIKTIYFGGGTPSLLTKDELESLIESIYINFDVEKNIEFTLEANPDDIHEMQLKYWKSLGVNRLSIGVQSFFQADLDWMNRAHNVEEGIKSIQLAKEHGFFITCDLIYGLPNHTLEKLEYNLSKMINLSPNHISAYCLTTEDGTALSYMIKTKQLPRVGADAQAEEFEYLVRRLQEAGYEQYEISNFAKNNQYSVHNTNYWLGISYLGIGPSAHSFNGKSRQWNVANNHKYIKAILDGQSYSEKEVLTQKNQFNEYLLTGLRTKWGVNLTKLAGFLAFSSEFEQNLEDFKQKGLIFEENGVIILTNRGKLQADYITSILFA